MKEYGESTRESSRGGGSPTAADSSAVLAELVDEAVVGVGSDRAISSANSRFEILTGTTASDAVGQPLSAFVVASDADRLDRVCEALRSRGHGAQTTLGVSLRTDAETAVACQLSLAAVDQPSASGGTATGIVGTVRPVDIADAELKRRASQQAAVASLGQLALESDDLDELMAEATRLVSETLDCGYSKVLDLDADDGTLRLRQGVGWRAGQVGTATVDANTNSQAGYTLATDRPVIVDDLDAETRFTGPELLTSHGITSGVSAVIGSVDAPWGVLGVHDSRHRQFTDDDATFVRSIATVLASAIDRRAYERRLETKRTKLAALNEVNTVVREIANAIIDQSTRREIEQLVCESLAALDAYQFAWIGEVDAHTAEIEPLAEARVEGYLDAVRISVDPADPMSRGPAGRAVESQQLAVSQDVFTDPRFEPWQATAKEWGYQSVAAIPITHNGTLYGVLGLYSDEADAFAAEKRAIIEQLGEIVGHAIAAVERKQALMSDAVTELEFEIRDVLSVVDTSATVDGEVVLDHVIAVGNDTYLQYGRTAPELVPTLETLAAQHPAGISFTVLSDDGTEVRFEQRLSEPPVTSVVAEAGGSVAEATITDSDLRITVHLPQSTDVRRLLDRIEQRYSDVRPIARRQVDRGGRSSKELASAVSEALTDKQRASLEAAYFAGFFEWPRNSSGEDLAETMGVSPATFHQHLRAAERKLFAALLDGER